MPAAEKLPLPALLSQALVAFTIEFDNEFERRMPHRTTVGGGRDGPWLVSMAIWFNCMRFVGEEGITGQAVARLARTRTNWHGMVRWGYAAMGQDKLIRATAIGLQARAVWEPLVGEIEKRWETRSGKKEMGRLKAALRAIERQFPVELPDCMPLLGYGLFSRGTVAKREERKEGEPLPLPALLARVLLGFALVFERESDLSLAICANVVRVLDETGVPVRELPVRSGVSSEAIAMALGVLVKRGLAVVETGAGRAAGLTRKGVQAQVAYRRLLSDIEKRWNNRFGADAMRELRIALEGLDLFRGLTPYPAGWRALRARPETLPHYPMVLHRGGFPDGS